MSNRALAITVAIIVIVAAVAAVVLYSKNSSQPMEDQYNTQSSQNTQPQQSTQSSAQQQPVAQAQPETLNGCTRNFDPNKLKTAKVDIANKFVTLSVKGFGDIRIQLYDKDAPKTVENFLRLANSGYYDCLTFHRVAKGFVIQGGDPTGKGSGGDSAFGGTFEDELNANTPSYKTGYVKGVVAMANRGPNTNTSQFFILIGDASDVLPHNYTIFGKVVAGQSVADKIGQVEIIPQLGPTDGAPKVPIVITKAAIK